MTWLDKLNRRFGRFALKNLMTYIVGLMAFVFILDFIFAASFERAGGIWADGLTGLLMFDRAAILQHNQWWRLVSFIIIPPDSSPLWIIFSLYFYWIVGKYLEAQWGSFRFGFYYFCGILCTVASGFISGYATNSYLNLSLFLAFATFFPNYQMMLFFIIPIKMKWLGIADAALLGLSMIRLLLAQNWWEFASLVAAVANFLIFFGPYFFNMFINFIRRKRSKARYDGSVRWGETQNRNYWKNR